MNKLLTLFFVISALQTTHAARHTYRCTHQTDKSVLVITDLSEQGDDVVSATIFSKPNKTGSQFEESLSLDNRGNLERYKKNGTIFFENLNYQITIRPLVKKNTYKAQVNTVIGYTDDDTTLVKIHSLWTCNKRSASPKN